MNYSSFLLDDIRKLNKENVAEILRHLSAVGYDDYEIIEHLELDEQKYEEIVYYGAKINSKEALHIRSKLISFVIKNPQE